MDNNLLILKNIEELKQILIENNFFDAKSLSDLLSISKESETKSQLLLIIADIESRDESEINRFGDVLRQTQLIDENLLVPSDQTDGSTTFNDMTAELVTRVKHLMTPSRPQSHVLTVKKAKKIKSTEKYEDVYTMTARPRGFCIIIDNQQFSDPKLPFRLGSKADADRLTSVFSQLDFDVLRFTNKTSDQMSHLFASLAINTALVGHNALAVIVLSHGDGDEIYGTDGLTLPIDTILGYFNNKKCHLLRHKPKMFFFSSCRGDKADEGVEDNYFKPIHSLSGTALGKANTLPTWSDMFVYYSTVGGFASLRNTATGSWFGYELAHCLAEFAHIEHLHDLVTIKVADRLQERESVDNSGRPVKQAIETQTKGRVKKLFFNPGLSELKE